MPTRAAQISDQMFSAEMQDDAQEFAGAESQATRTEGGRQADQSDDTTRYAVDVGAESDEADRKQRVELLHTTIAAEDRARADKYRG